MNASFYQAASALSANARWQEVISDNLASSSIPGFKKQDVSFSTIEAGLNSAQAAAKPNATGSLLTANNSINFSQGELKPSGNSTDLALEGDGFFEVTMPNGTPGYTRDGEFRMDAQGKLVTKQGWPVMGESGPIQLNPGSGAPLQVSANGQISQGGEIKGTIKVVDFPDRGKLASLGGGCFAPSEQGIIPGPSKASVIQGFLETGNTSSVNEMVHLISSMRMFEANQRVLQSHDERLGKLISETTSPM